MMNVHCLSPSEVKSLLLYLDGMDDPEKTLLFIIDAAYKWQLHVICFSLFAARYLNLSDRGLERLKQIYLASEESAIGISEGGVDFVEYLLRSERNPDETLDEALVTILQRLSAHDYTRTLRY